MSKETLIDKFENSLLRGKMRLYVVTLDARSLPNRVLQQEKYYIVDIKYTFQILLGLVYIRSKVYRGMVIYTDKLIVELWECPWWGQSVRITSGQYFKYPDSILLFPSDFIWYTCCFALGVENGYCKYL